MLMPHSSRGLLHTYRFSVPPWTWGQSIPSQRWQIRKGSFLALHKSPTQVSQFSDPVRQEEASVSVREDTQPRLTRPSEDREDKYFFLDLIVNTILTYLDTRICSSQPLLQDTWQCQLPARYYSCQRSHCPNRRNSSQQTLRKGSRPQGQGQ